VMSAGQVGLRLAGVSTVRVAVGQTGPPTNASAGTTGTGERGAAAVPGGWLPRPVVATAIPARPASSTAPAAANPTSHLCRGRAGFTGGAGGAEVTGMPCAVSTAVGALPISLVTSGVT